MADSGKNASFIFGGTTYDADDCLQDWNLDNTIEDIVYYCNGFAKHAPGTQTIIFTTSLALAKDDTTKATALVPGSTGAFEAHPGGDVAGNIELTATRGLITSAPMSAPVNGFIQLDLTIALDDLTVTTAT